MTAVEIVSDANGSSRMVGQAHVVRSRGQVSTTFLYDPAYLADGGRPIDPALSLVPGAQYHPGLRRQRRHPPGRPALPDPRERRVPWRALACSAARRSARAPARQRRAGLLRRSLRRRHTTPRHGNHGPRRCPAQGLGPARRRRSRHRELPPLQRLMGRHGLGGHRPRPA